VVAPEAWPLGGATEPSVVQRPVGVKPRRPFYVVAGGALTAHSGSAPNGVVDEENPCAVWKPAVDLHAMVMHLGRLSLCILAPNEHARC